MDVLGLQLTLSRLIYLDHPLPNRSHPPIAMNGNPATAPSGSTPPPDTASAISHAQPQTFHCIPCGRTIATRESSKHLGGKPHRAAIDAQQRKALAAEQRRKKQLAVSAAAPTTGAKSGAWECVVCQREMVRATRTSHLAGAPHARMVLYEKEKQEKFARMALAEKQKQEKFARMAIAEKQKQEEVARMALAEKEKGQDAELVLAQAAAAKKADDDWAAVVVEFKRLVENKRIAEIARLIEIERLAHLEHAAREEQEQLEKAAEEERQRQRDKEKQEIALMAQRQRDLIMEAERKVQMQRELHKQRELQQQQELKQLKQMKKKERKTARQNTTIVSSSVRAPVARTNGDGGTGGSRAKMLEFLQAQHFLRCNHFNSPMAQRPTTEYERTG